MKINAAATDFVYSTYLGGSGIDQIWGLALGADGSAYVAGWTTDGSFPQKDSVQSYKGGQDSFAARLSPTGDRLVYSSLLGGDDDEFTTAIAVDTVGNAYVTGTTRSFDFPKKNAYQATLPDLTNANGLVGYLYRLSAVNLTPPAVQVAPGSLAFQSDAGGPAPEIKTLSVTVSNGGLPAAFTVTVNTPGEHWLAITPSVATTPAQLSVSVNPAGLAAGQYNGSIAVTPQDGVPATVPVSLRVYSPAAVSLRVSPDLIPQGSRDTGITITGSNIVPDAKVSLLLPVAIPLASTVVNSTTIRATLPSLYLAATRTLSVMVTNPGAQPSSLLNIYVVPVVPILNNGGIVNTAALAGVAVAPGELVTLFGSSLSTGQPETAQFDSTGHLPTVLNTVRVLFNGQPAPLLYVSATQINTIAPYAIANLNTVPLQVELNGVMSEKVLIPVAPAVPGVFTISGTGTGPGAILNESFAVNSAGDPAAPGSIVMIYATGAGLLDESREDGTRVSKLAQTAVPVIVLIDGQEAEVLYAGSVPGLVEGVLQVNARVPAGTRAGAKIPLQIRVGTATSQADVTLAIR